MSQATVIGGEQSPALTASAIGKSFGPVHALDGVDLELWPGRVLALMGENGAGKSTLLKIISGDYRADQGTLTVDEDVVSFHGTADAKRLGIRVIAQEPEIIPHVTVAENVYVGSLPTRSGRYDRSGLMEQVRRDITDYGFADVLAPGQLGSDLSPAQRQLVEVMRGLAAKPRIIAFDEPTSSLSESEVETLFKLIRQLKARGAAVLYVSHRMREIFDIADDAAVLRDGKLVGVRHLAETSEKELVSMMVGRDLSAIFDKPRGPSGAPALEVKGLSNEHVHDIDLTVHAGEIVAIAGLVGAGRSELARTIVGDFQADSGTVAVTGKMVKLRGPEDAVRAGIGLAPEERKAQALLLQRSVRENVSLVMLRRISRLRLVNRAKERTIVGEQVERMRVRTPSIEQEVSKLSGGNQQKVVLARWLARRPAVLILDEPTRGVDVGAKAEIYAIIEELAAEGMAILVISSELPEVIGLGDRILTMQAGRITGQVTRADATEERLLELILPDRVAADTATDSVPAADYR